MNEIGLRAIQIADLGPYDNDDYNDITVFQLGETTEPKEVE